MRSSSAAVILRSGELVPTSMVRSLSISNGLPLKPARLARWNAGPGEVSRIIRAPIRIKGQATRSTKNEKTMSNRRLIIGSLNEIQISCYSTITGWQKRRDSGSSRTSFSENPRESALLYSLILTQWLLGPVVVFCEPEVAGTPNASDLQQQKGRNTAKLVDGRPDRSFDEVSAVLSGTQLLG